MQHQFQAARSATSYTRGCRCTTPGPGGEPSCTEAHRRHLAAWRWGRTESTDNSWLTAPRNNGATMDSSSLADLYETNPAVRAVLDSGDLTTEQRTDALNRLVGAMPAAPVTVPDSGVAPDSTATAPDMEDPRNWSMEDFAKRRGAMGMNDLGSTGRHGQHISSRGMFD